MQIYTGIAKQVVKGLLMVASALSPVSAIAMTGSGEVRPVVVATDRPAMTLIVPNRTLSTGNWTWVADADGRLVEISGRQLVGATELVLEDSSTGQVVWHERVQYAVPGFEGHESEVVHPGVKVQSGHSYRLRAVYVGSAPEQTLGDLSPRFVVFARSAVSTTR